MFYYAVGINACFMILQLKPNLGKEKDPMAGIMDLMKVCGLSRQSHLSVHLCLLVLSYFISLATPIQTSIIYLQNMYEEGDDEMKRTIAKAWSDARSGKAADPLKGYP